MDTLPALWARSVDAWPDRELIVTPDRRLDYREADRLSLDWARRLVACGAGKGSRVGLLMANGPDWVIGWLATTRIGAIAVPLSTFFQPPELSWILRHADVEILLVERSIYGRDFVEVLETSFAEIAGRGSVRRGLAGAPFLREVLFVEAAPQWGTSLGDVEVPQGVDEALVLALQARVSPADLAVTLYSSGSTARPKGVLHTHGGMVRHLDQIQPYRQHEEADRVFMGMPFFWVGGLVVGLLDAVLSGSTCLVSGPGTPASILRFLSRERVTVLGAWPASLEGLRREFLAGDYDLSGVRAGNLVEALPPELRPADPLLRTNSLGMTETCGPHTWGAPGEDLPERHRGSFGRAVPDVEHRIVDPESGEILGPGNPGEIEVRGPNMMVGLHKRERSAFLTPDGWYRTGDHGFFDPEGHLFFQGRRDEMIKTAGVSVSAREVEAALVGLVGVRLAAVVGLPHASRGSSVAAAVVAEEGVEVTPSGLREQLRPMVSAYMVPRRIWVCTLSDVPMTASGKVDKRRLEVLLREKAESPVED
jgi:acyl-CoA synthetase (AMP-forming)/AMP-acid ligase II